MKKIGIFCGADTNFPFSLIDYINSKVGENIAEMVSVEAFRVGEKLDYGVIFDRVSREVPMYQAILKSLVLKGIIVINNPFLKCLEDYFFQLSIAKELNLNIPETAIIPTKEHPIGTTSDTFRNLVYPLNWSELFEYIGFPMYMKSNLLGFESMTYKVFNPAEFFNAYDYSGSKQFVVQRAYDYTNFFRAFVIGRKYVKIFNYNPSQPLVYRYSRETSGINPAFKNEIEAISKKLCTVLNLDFNTIDFGIYENKVYVVNFYNTSPKINSYIFSTDEFEWFVFTTGDYLISLLEDPKEYLRNSQWYNIFKKK
jgi:hypothetical protein